MISSFGFWCTIFYSVRRIRKSYNCNSSINIVVVINWPFASGATVKTLMIYNLYSTVFTDENIFLTVPTFSKRNFLMQITIVKMRRRF